MQLSDILSPACIKHVDHAASKKELLELLSDLLADHISGIDKKAVLSNLLSRERLGSTALGHGVAIPHSRIEGLEYAIAAFIQLNEGVDFAAKDHEPVDLCFALLVPEDATEEHLEILATIAKQLNDSSLREQLRAANDEQQLYQLIANSHGTQ